MEEFERVRLPRNGEMFAVVEARLGTNKIKVFCQDSKTRIARIPGKFKKRLWIIEGDIVLVKPWDIQGEERCDIAWRYTRAQADNLRRKGLLKLDL